MSQRQFVEELRETTLGCSLDRSQFGASRKVSAEQRTRMAELFGADSGRLSANKKLINKRHEAYLKVTTLLNQARQTWHDNTVPYPIDGIRLIRRDRVASFDAAMRAIKAELETAKIELERVYHDELIPDAQQRLGGLYSASDFPVEIGPSFDIEWGYPSVEPSEYLREVSPRLYEQQQERVRARFEEAIALTEQAFLQEFAKMIEHLVDRLTPSPDGKKKVFRDSSLENLNEFFDRFRSLNIGSNQELEAMVDHAKQAISGIDMKRLRNDITVQDSVRGSMQDLASRLDAMIVDRPSRRITLADAAAAAAAEGGEAESQEGAADEPAAA